MTKALRRKAVVIHLSRPLAHIFRFAVVGSLTRRGGVIRHASGGATTGGLQVARVGDKVVYADGVQRMRPA